MAIRRQRRRRDEALRAKARRSSHQSDHLMLSDSGEGSMMSLDTVYTRSTRHRQMMGGVTTFHVGIVFFLMGLMLLISGIVPGYTNRQKQFWEERHVSTSPIWDREGKGNSPLLLATGSFLILIGVVLVIANRIAVRKEDEQFSRYISRKLALARMTHHPISSIQPCQQHLKPIGNNKEESRELDGELHRVINHSSTSRCPSPGQLESITEEAEGSEKASKDQLFWTSEVAPVHVQPNDRKFLGEASHFHLSAYESPHNKHHLHGSSTG